MNQTKKQKNKYSMLKPLWIGIFSDILGFSLMVTLLPAVKDLFATTPLQATLLLSINALFGVIFGPIHGKLSDKYGRKPILLMCQIGTVSSFVLFAFANSYWLLLLSRILDGVFGGNFPISKAIIGDVVEPKDRTKQMSNVSLIFAVSNVLGPGISALLVSIGKSLMLPGLFSAILSLVALITTQKILPETAPCKVKKSVSSEQEEAVIKEKPKMNIKDNKDVKLLLLQWSFHTLSLTLIYSCVALFAQDKFGLSTEVLGLILLSAGIMQIVFRLAFFMPVVKNLGEKLSALIGLGLFCVIYIWLAFVGSIWQLIIIILLQGVASSLVRSVLSSFISQSVDAKDQGAIQGLSSGLDTLGQLIAPFIGGLLLSYLPLQFFGLCAAMIASFALLIGFVPLKIERKSDL